MEARRDTAHFAALELAFAEAAALDGVARERWLAALDTRDPVLAGEVRALLAASERQGPMDALAARLTPVRQVLAPPPSWRMTSDAMPAHVGPYELVTEIGRGAMGVVYRAHDPRLGRDVAVKIFAHDHGLPGETEGERRLVAEARAASALDHPHICTIHDLGTLPDGRPWFAMAYYANGTLADRIAAGPLPAAEAREVAIQLAEALAAAHAAGIVHRDVKPRNVAFAEHDVAKLLDFGVALLRHEHASAASAGTPAYMAPEQVFGEAVDARADVWAVGVVLFEMLTGRRPFAGRDTTELLRAILEDPAPDVRTLRPDVPPALARTVARALAKSPEQRHASAAQLAAELRAAHRASVIGREAVAIAGRRTRPVIAGAVLVALAAVGVATWYASTLEIPGSPSVHPDPVGAIVERARERYHQRTEEGTEEAIALLGTALARDSMDASAHALLARALVRATQPAGAREGQVSLLDSAATHARRAVALAPRRPDVHAALGNVLAAQRRHAEAVAHFERALDLEPRDVQATMDLSTSWSALGRTDEAMALTERALAIDPQFPEVREIAVGRYRGLAMWPEARRHVTEGLRRDPTNASLQWQATLLALDEGDSAGARRALDSTLAVRSGAEQVRLRGWYEMYRGDPVAARPWVERVVATGSTSYDRYMYGSVLLLTGDRQRGDSLLRLEVARLTSERARSAGTSRQLGLALASLQAGLGEREQALATLERWFADGGKYHWLELERWPKGWGAMWAALRNDARFREIVAVSRQRLAETRAQVRARVAASRLVP